MLQQYIDDNLSKDNNIQTIHNFYKFVTQFRKGAKNLSKPQDQMLSIKNSILAKHLLSENKESNQLACCAISYIALEVDDVQQFSSCLNTIIQLLPIHSAGLIVITKIDNNLEFIFKSPR